MVMAAVMFWQALEGQGELRLKLAALVIPAFVLSAVILMCASAAGRMLYPPDVGSEGKDVIDLEKEAEEAVGLVIQPDQFPDRLFAPPKKQELMPDGRNPVYDKELHSEIFSQGTLMLRLVIQISMLLAIPLMGVFLFWQIERCAWFSVYVIVFNMLVGPVFLAGSMTSERERETLDLLLTTTLTPWQILSGKFIVGFRISAVLTSFLLWPLLLGTALNMSFWSNWLAVACMFAIVAMVCLVNAIIALVCSLFTKRTSISLLSTYTALLLLYVAPPAIVSLLQILDFTPERIAAIQWSGITSPFSALFAIPLDEYLNRVDPDKPANLGNLAIVAGYFVFSTLLICVSCVAMVLRLRSRRGLSE
jgi:ABC-type transport system involved in multi-copper enzyme maturation permease subunit